MAHPFDPVGRPWLRRAVLALAVMAATALAVALGNPPAVHVAIAAEKVEPGASPAPAAQTPPTAPQSPASGAPAGTAPSASPPQAGGETPDSGAADARTEVTIDHHGVGVLKQGKRVEVRGFGTDREYDSFKDFVNDAPWLAALVFLLVLLFFLTPLLILVLIIWYKMRKTRMQNETMLKLAEKGVVPPAEAMQALAAQAPAGIPPSAGPLYEQARQFRRRAAWSDLRKGVVLIAVGMGFMFYSMLADGEPNWVGLICFFLGIGYTVLWFFEDRQAGSAAGGPPAGSA